MAQKPVKHGPDHMPGGFDPIPGLSGGGGITQITSSDGSINVSNSTGPITDLTTYTPQFEQSAGSVTLPGPGFDYVVWSTYLGDTLLDYTAPASPAPVFDGWYEISAYAIFSYLDSPYASAVAILSAFGGYAPSPSSYSGGLGSAAFGFYASCSIPALQMTPGGGVAITMGVSTDSAIGCTVTGGLNVARVRPGP